MKNIIKVLSIITSSKKCINKIKKLFNNFIDFLENNNIKYSLYGGTLLGCIRDGDIILWDDDYDIFIPSIRNTARSARIELE